MSEEPTEYRVDNNREQQKDKSAGGGFRVFGVAILIAAIIAAVIMLNKAGNYISEAETTLQVQAGGIFVAGTILGMLFIGIGKIIELLNQIAEKE